MRFRLVALLLIAVFTLPGFSCDGPGNGSSGPTVPFDPASAMTSDWFGDIVVSETTAYIRNTTPAPGATLHEDHTHTIAMKIKVTPEGVRSKKISASLHDHRRQEIRGNCYFHRTTATVTADALEKELPLIPTGIPAGALPPGLIQEGFFKLSVDAAGAYAFAEGPVVSGQVETTTSTSGHEDIETCDDGYSNGADTTSPFGMNLAVAMDRMKGRVAPDAKGAVGEETWRERDTIYTLRWSLKKAKDIEAKVGGPYSVERGAKVTLDGSSSRGEIDRYVWKLTPRSADCSDNSTDVGLQVGQQVEQEGKTYTFTALCNLDVKLTVYGPRGQDSDNSGEVIAHRRAFEVKNEGASPMVVDFNPADGGRNRCAYEPIGGANHWIHKAGDDGFEVKQVDDPDGPFKGAFYIASTDLKVKRREELELAYRTGGSIRITIQHAPHATNRET